MLKPALARGELRCIGATTLDEYRKHIEKDAALERRFQPVFVGEPTVEDTIAILRGLKERYEVHHGVRIQDARWSPRPCCRTATSPTLPARQGHRPGRRGRVALDGDRLDAHRDRRSSASASQLEIERRPGQGEGRTRRKERLEEVEKEIADLQEQRDAMRAQWQREKELIGRGPRR
jgi:ATP-dependent Clp protease ATP-binding subunit ClpB